MKCMDFVSAETLDEALAYLKRYSDKTMIVAGGTDVVVKARRKDWYAGIRLLNIEPIASLRYIRDDGDVIRIGALTRIADVLESELIKTSASLLWYSCLELASPQIRNKATIGGNLANGCLAGDVYPSLCAMRATLTTVSPDGEKTLAVSDLMKKCSACLNHEMLNVSGCFYACPAGKKTVLASSDIITEIIVPKMDTSYRIYFNKIGEKNSGCMSQFTLALAIKMEEGKAKDVRLSIGSAFSQIQELKEAEKDLEGVGADDTIIDEVAVNLGNQIEAQQKVPNDNLRYKAEVCRRLLARTLKELMRDERD